MIYPNGFIDIENLKKKVLDSEKFIVYAEAILTDVKLGDIVQRGIKVQIKTIDELAKFILNDNYTICYDYTDVYFDKHPHTGETIKRKQVLEFSGRNNYAINDYGDGYEIVQFNGDFESSCFVIGYIKKTKDDYYFRSVGDRFFNIPDEDYVYFKDTIKKYISGEWS
ncbi:MAG: hypothetical protein HUJ68_13085 [Clostridia bacterium]|nr:hypothetical protein [Clostridia bacterium]